MGARGDDDGAEEDEEEDDVEDEEAAEEEADAAEAEGAAKEEEERAAVETVGRIGTLLPAIEEGLTVVGVLGNGPRGEEEVLVLPLLAAARGIVGESRRASAISRER